MKYINQLEYAHIPYHTRVSVEGLTDEERLRSVRKSGCGLCCTCMAIELLTDTSLDIEECVRISEGCVANHSTGTDMTVLGPVIAEKFDLEYFSVQELDEAIELLRSGAQIICHVGHPEGKPGLFTLGGHYILLTSTDGKEFCILDPSYKDDKFDLPERVGKVDTSRAPYLYCDVNIVHSETKKRKYHVFKRKR